MRKISIMTMVFGGYLDDGKLTDASMLAVLEKMGYDGVELYSARLDKGMRQYQTYLANSKLEITCIDGISNFASRDKDKREEAGRMLDAAIKAAVELKAPVVLAAGSNLSGDITPEEARDMIIDGLRPCAASAKAAGVKLAIEDFGVAPRLQCTAADCLAILDAIPDLGFVFDTGNFYFRQEDPLKNLPLLRSRICHVHLKDWVKSDKPEIADVAGVALGTGFIPNQEIIKQLLDSGYSGNFSIELGAPGDKIEGARRDLETVKSWLGKSV